MKTSGSKEKILYTLYINCEWVLFILSYDWWLRQCTQPRINWADTSKEYWDTRKYWRVQFNGYFLWNITQVYILWSGGKHIKVQNTINKDLFPKKNYLSLLLSLVLSSLLMSLSLSSSSSSNKKSPFRAVNNPGDDAQKNYEIANGCPEYISLICQVVIF